MGNESSQMEKPRDSPSRVSQDEVQKINLEEADALSVAGSNKTSGSNQTSASRALARDLEQSVMNSSQDYLIESLPKKRAKRKRTSAQSQSQSQSQVQVQVQVQVNTIEEAADIPPEVDVLSPEIPQTQSDSIQPDDQADDETASQSNMSADEPTRDPRAAARKRLVKELRRMKKTVLVTSGKAKWAPRTSGAKWEMEKLAPSQWPKRKLTKAEEQTLAKYRAKVKEAKQQLEDFDRDTAQQAGGGGVQGDELMKDEDAAEGGVDGQASEQAVVEAELEEEEEQPEVVVQSAEKSPRKEREKSKRALRRHSKLNVDPEVSTGDEQRTVPAQELEPEPRNADRPRKKRKRQESQAMTSSPPQQLTIAQSRPALRSVAGKHKTELVKSWLNNQEPVEDMVDVPEEDDLEVPEPSRKRKRVSTYKADDDADFQARSADEDDSQPADSDEDYELRQLKPNAKEGSSRKSKKPASLETPASLKEPARPGEQLTARHQVPTTSSGPFTTEEKAIADDMFAEVLRLERINEDAMKHKICTWRTVGIFKDKMEAALPSRNKAAIRRFCQRRYHMQERGPWTAEQDEDLRTAQADYPNMWRKHQDIVGRTAADCKDRWTMHVQYTKRTGAWSQQEEQALEAAVESAIDTIKNDKTMDPNILANPAAIEELLNWVKVARKLDNNRNRKQCREKYANLKLRGKRVSDNPDKRASTQPFDVRNKRYQANKIVRTFEIGDFYDVFVEIHTSFDDISAQFHDEESVLWSIVSTKNPGSRFSLTYLGAPLRRAALEHALKEWKIDSGKVRRKLAKSETLPAKAKVLANLLERSYKGRLHAMSRTFKPEMIGKSEEEILRIKKERKAVLAERRAKKKAKAKGRSEEFVDDDDGEEDGVSSESGTPAVDGEEEDESDDGGSDGEQSVCQRRLNAQLNGREEDIEEGAESGDDLPSGRDVSLGRRSSRLRNLADDDAEDEEEEPVTEADGEEEPTTDAEDDPIKKEESDSDSDDYRDQGPADPEHDAEMLRRFAAAIEDADSKRVSSARFPSTPDRYEYHSSDDDGGGKQAAVDKAYGYNNRYSVSPNGEETPVVGRAEFVKVLRA